MNGGLVDGGVTVRCLTYDREVVGSTRSPVAVRWFTFWMGDCLRTDKQFRYITNTKINSVFHPSGVGEYRSVWLEFRRSAFTCVGWQIILCDPLRQVTLRWVSHKKLYTIFLTFNFVV